MPGLLQLLIAAALGLALSAAPVAAQDIRINPVPPHVRPNGPRCPTPPGSIMPPIFPPTSSATGANTIFTGKGISIGAASPEVPGSR